MIWFYDSQYNLYVNCNCHFQCIYIIIGDYTPRIYMPAVVIEWFSIVSASAFASCNFWWFFVSFLWGILLWASAPKYCLGLGDWFFGARILEYVLGASDLLTPWRGGGESQAEIMLQWCDGFNSRNSSGAKEKSLAAYGFRMRHASRSTDYVVVV